MRAFIIYCHPSEDSFTRNVRDRFIKGIVDSGNTYILSDLYKMNFKTDMSEKEYLRDSHYEDTTDIADDVIEEQNKINESDALVFIYPVFWTEAPAKLVGWFDRVWTYGFAYGQKRLKMLEKGIILCTAGNTKDKLDKFGLLASMKKVMLGDRLFNRVKRTDFVVLDRMTRASNAREANWKKYLEVAYEKGRTLFINDQQPCTVDNKYFIAAEYAHSGDVSENTVFSYHQRETVIWSEYSGGKIVKGFLIGNIDKENNLHFRYQHMNIENEITCGACNSRLEMLDNGKMRFYENWKLDTGEVGSSVIEEI